MHMHIGVYCCDIVPQDDFSGYIKDEFADKTKAWTAFPMLRKELMTGWIITITTSININKQKSLRMNSISIHFQCVSL